MNPVDWPVAVTAVPLGIAFGVILERVGLGDPRVIAAQFTGRDFTVVRVMLGTIVTAMLGVAWLGAAGWIDPGAIAIPPTDLAGQAIGAVIFGGGFALAALCPGTACVAASSGRRDGLAAVAGMFAGTLLTALLWPALGSAAAETPREAARLPADLGVSTGSVVVAITVMGVLASMIARRFEKRDPSRAWWRPRTMEAVGLTLAGAFVLVDGRTMLSPPEVAAIAGEIAREEDHVDALDLAEWIRERRSGLRVIDVREGLDSSIYRIPGSASVPLEQIASLDVKPGEHLVLYSDGGTHAAQAWVLLRGRGVTTVSVLKDGMAAWEDEVLRPARPTVSDDSATKRFARARELSLWYGGRPRLIPIPDAESSRPALPALRRRRNTC
jgi:rhodanese-related sulfurtransferase/uncharacterized membrane protein YedE/YeeE